MSKRILDMSIGFIIETEVGGNILIVVSKPFGGGGSP